MTVASDGYMFGHNCSTAGYEPVPGNGSYDTKLNLELSEVVGNFREALKIFLWFMFLVVQGTSRFPNAVNKQPIILHTLILTLSF